MSGSIGLAELIQQVKQELLTPSENENDIPLWSVDSVELELQVTVNKEEKGGIKIYVLELGGAQSHDRVQKVKLKLSPLLNKERLLEIYEKKYPEKFKEVEDKSVTAGIKGNENPGF